MNVFSLKGNVSDEAFFIFMINNLPMKYDIILDGLENHLISKHEKLRIIIKKKEKKKRPWDPTANIERKVPRVWQVQS